MINKTTDSIRIRFKLWQLRGYPWVPNWYKNLSILWSKKEQNLQAGVARTHKAIGESLMTETEFMAALPIQPGSYGVEELSIEGDMSSDTLIVNIKDNRSWCDKLYDEEGIIL